MNLLSLTDVSLSLGGLSLFEQLTLGIDAGDKIGLIGPNGAGKSTFLSLLSGHKQPDTGKQYRRGGLRVAQLPQIPRVPEGAAVADLVFRSNDPRAALVREYESLMAEFQETDLERLDGVLRKMDRENAWNMKNEYHSVLTELGIGGLERRASELSGGELRKADMARVLASKADLLLLDEPTNHLDLETVEWLERWLRNGRRTYVLVTHDRSFLENSCDVILELEERRFHRYPGNWSAYLKMRSKRLEEEEKGASKKAAILRREMEWASRRPKARTGKDKNRLSRIDDLQNALQADRRQMAEFSSGGRRLGKKVLEMVNIEKSRDGRQIILPFSYRFRRGERIGVAGPNGAGKSTLMSIASGALTPDAGRIDVGVHTRFAVLDQSPLAADESLSIADYMKEETENVRRPDGTLVDVLSWLERFGFGGMSRRRKIRYLSGGERRRLQVVKMLTHEPNFLILDEPTNDLDLATLEMLERFLEEYEGCLMVVSHDRVLLERIVDYLFILDGSGIVRGVSGTWSEYRNLTRDIQRDEALEERRKHGGVHGYANRTPRKGLTFKERQRMEKLLEEIDSLEAELSEVEKNFFQSNPDPAVLAAAGRRHEPLLNDIAAKTRCWEELAEREV